MTPRSRLPWVLLVTSFAACAPKHHPVTNVAHGAPLALPADPRLVEMTAEATSPLVLASARTELGVRLQIFGRELPAARRPALNLGLVLDTSGSMEGASIEAVRASATALVDKLRDGDRIALVAFHSHADVLVPSVVVGPATRDQLRRAIAGIRARGTTDLAGGLAAGLYEVQRAQLPQGINRLVLLSDGVPNTSAALPGMISNLHQLGISVTSLGLGVDYDTTLMTQVARDTGGTFHYIERPEDVAPVFDGELTKMTTVVGRNLQLLLEPGPGVTIEAMPGLTSAGDGKFYATVGDLAAGETRDLMIPIELTARGDGSTAELVEATLTFDDVINRSGQQKREAFVGAKASTDAAAIKASMKIGLEAARVRASAAAAMLGAIELARAGQVEPARQRLAKEREQVKAAIARLHDADLEALVRELDALGKQLASLAVPPPVNRIGVGGPRPAAPPATAPAPVEQEIRRTEERATATVRGQR